MRKLRLTVNGGLDSNPEQLGSRLKGRKESNRPSRQGQVLCNSIEGGKMLPKSFEELKVSGSGNRSPEMTQLHLQG